MRIYFYPECNFNINKASVYDCGSLAEWFDSRHVNPDDYEIVGKDGEYHDSGYEGEVCAVFPKIMGGKKNGKNILTAVIGLALVLTGGGALFANFGGATMAKTLGAGLLLSGGGALLMGKMKMPSMDLSSESSAKQSYQWNVGNLSTSRGVKGVTFGSNVIPEGELLAYKTYGTSSLEEKTHTETSGHWENYLTPNGKLQQKWVTTTKEVRDGFSNTDNSSYLELLIGAGEGELDSITDIKINDIPLADLGMVENTDYAIRLGSNTQTALKQTNLDSQAGYSSIGQTVPVKLNNSVTPLLITTPSVCDSCCIAFQAPNWYLYDTSSGAKNNAYIKLKIGYRVSGSSGDYTYLTKTISEIDNKYPIKSESAFYFQVVIKFPSNGTYQISLENDSAELNYTKGLLSQAEYQGSALPDRASINISCDNIACYNNKEQTYPNTALIWLRIPASQTLNGSMPKVTWKQTRANIYAYNGSSYITKPANNLAWAIYDIIAQVRKDGNTYHNEGEDVANIDYNKFVAFATFCESIGAMGNWFLNKLDTSWSNAMSVATSCRSFIGLRSGKVCPYWDAPTEMTQIFTVGNYENMSGVITAKKDRAKAIEATFNNEEEKYTSRTIRVEIDNDHSAEAVSMTFVGLSDPVNVSKAAHYILRRNKYLVQSIKFTADIDSIVCELNDVIGIQCDLTEYGVGGRIFKVENSVISLDAPVTLESGKTYALLVRHTDGTLERNTPVETNGTYTQLTFNTAWSKPVLKGDVYSFGIANSEVRKYRVTGITRTNDLKAQIEAIEYNENVYDELAVAPYTYTNPNAGINNVTTTYTPESVELAWDANNNTSYVNVYVDGVFYGRFKNGAEIPNINSQQQIELVPVNEYGEEDTAVVRTISNNLPTPSTPSVPVVQSTSTGVVAEFSGIPKDENIVWLIIKEGENELGRVNILGEYMSVSIQLKSGTHTLSAYFVNQFSKSSQARTFTATPLNDITANNISASALKMPTGSILRLSAKNCTTASIALDNGVKDCSGMENNGKATSNVSVVRDDEKGDVFNFGSASGGITIANNIQLDPSKGVTFAFYVNSSSFNVTSSYPQQIRLYSSSSGGFICRVISTLCDFLHYNGSTQNWVLTKTKSFALNKWHHFAFTADSTGSRIYYNGEQIAEDTSKKFTAACNTPLTINASGAGRASKLYDIRIYPRALSATEIKSVYMMPDEAVFAQLTTDMFGANIIHANYILNDGDFQSLAVNAVNANIQNLAVGNISIGNIGGYNSMISSVNQTAQGYATEAADSVSVGGRNLMKKAGAWSLYNSTTGTITEQDGNLKLKYTTPVDCANLNATKSGFKFTVGLDYTLSFNIKIDGSVPSANPFVTPNSSYYGSRKVTYDSTTGLYVISFTTVNTGNFCMRGFAYVSTFDKSVTHTVEITNIKAEYGNKVTTWTPAPEDVDADISAVETTANTADTTAQGIINDLVKGTTTYVAKVQGSMIVNGTLAIGKLESDTQTKINNGDSANDKVSYQYGTCSTAKGTAQKEVVITDYPGLFKGSRISVKFTNENTATSPTISINSGTAKPIYANGAALVAPYNWNAKDTVDFVYNGSQWEMTSISGTALANTAKTNAATAQTRADNAYTLADTANGTANGAAAALAAWCYNNDLTYINGANIYTGTVTATQMAANSITADKLNVISGIPRSCLFSLNFKSVQAATAGTDVPDLSGNNNSFKIRGTWNSLYRAATYVEYILLDNTSAGREHYIANQKAITVPASGWTFLVCAYAHANGSGEHILLDCTNGTDSKNRIQFRIDPDNTRVRLLSYNSSGTQESQYKTLSACSRGNYRVYIIQCTSTTSITVYCVDQRRGDQIATTSRQVTFTLSNARSELTAAVGYFRIGGTAGTTACICGNIGDIQFYNRSLSQAELASIVHELGNYESGLITAERIHTNAIKSRNYDGTTVDDHFATNGCFLNLADGTMKTKYFALEPEGGYFKGTVNATGGIIGINELNKTATFSWPYNYTSGLKYDSVNTNFCLYGTLPTGNYKVGIHIDIPSTTVGIGLHINNQGKRGGTSDRLESFGIFVENKPIQSYGRGIVVVNNGNYTTNTGIQIVNNKDNSDIGLDIYNDDDGSDIGAGISVTSRVNSGVSILNTNGCAISYDGWTTVCDESVKKEIKDVSTLEKLKEIKVKRFKYSQKARQEKTWRKKQILKNKEALKKGIKPEEEPIPDFKDDENAPDYIMAMAGEFNKAFGVDNGNEEYINYTNAIGVALRSIQELAEIVDSQKAEIAELKALLETENGELKTEK